MQARNADCIGHNFALAAFLAVNDDIVLVLRTCSFHSPMLRMTVEIHPISCTFMHSAQRESRLSCKSIMSVCGHSNWELNGQFKKFTHIMPFLILGYIGALCFPGLKTWRRRQVLNACTPTVLSPQVVIALISKTQHRCPKFQQTTMTSAPSQCLDVVHRSSGRSRRAGSPSLAIWPKCLTCFIPDEGMVLKVWLVSPRIHR